MGGRRRRRILVWLAVLLILGGGVGVWWWLRAPRLLRVVARFSHPVPMFAGFMTSPYPWMPQHVIPTAAGPLILDAPVSTFAHGLPLSATLRDWDGRQQWQVAIPGFTASSQVAISPDGRTLVLLRSDNPGLSLVFWRDGKRTGKTFLPVEMQQYGTFPQQLLTVTDAGQAWCLIPYRRDPLVVMDAHGLVARGAVQPPPLCGSVRQADISPDGTVMVTTGLEGKGRPLLEYSNLAIRQGRVVATPQYTAQDSPLRLREQGTLYCLSGDLYGPAGRRLKRKQLFDPYRLDDGFYLPSLTDSTGIQYGKDEAFVFPPHARQCWRIPRWFGDDATASRDGQFAFTFETGGRPMPRLLAALARRIHSVQELWQRRQPAARLAIYQAPGRLRAQIALPPGTDGHDFNLDGINADRVDGLFLSPDGRRAVVMITQPRSRSKIPNPASKDPQRNFVVLGW